MEAYYWSFLNVNFKYFVYVFKLKKLEIDNKNINIKCSLP